MKQGLFITLEGIDGTGKSTQLRLLVQHLRKRGLAVRATREPGGTKVGERIRKILLSSSTTQLTPLAELALMYAARAQHLQEVIRPTLTKGGIVVSDRYNDASLAYQGYRRELGTETVRALDRVICVRRATRLDYPPRPSSASLPGAGPVRESQRQSKQGRFESQGLSFYEESSGWISCHRPQGTPPDEGGASG